jgi:hypothetical protein
MTASPRFVAFFLPGVCGVFGEKSHHVAKRPPLVDKCLQTVLKRTRISSNNGDRVSFGNALSRCCGRIVSQGSQVLCIALRRFDRAFWFHRCGMPAGKATVGDKRGRACSLVDLRSSARLVCSSMA